MHRVKRILQPTAQRSKPIARRQNDIGETAPPVLTHAAEEPEQIDAPMERMSASTPLKCGPIPRYFDNDRRA